MQPRRLPAYTVYLILTGVSTFLAHLNFTVAAIHRIQVAGLDPLQLVLVGTVLEASAFVFEVPTGVVADTYSRRLSILIGVVLLGVSAILEGAVPVFSAILIAQVIAGLGYTFMSGATEAWIAGEVGEERVGSVFLRASQISQAGAIAGTLLSVALASAWLALPRILSGALTILLGILLAFVMPETGFRRAPREERETWGSMTETLRAGIGVVRGRPLLITILGIALFVGLSSEGYDRLWEAHFLRSFSFPALGSLEPVVWFGLINVGAMLLGIAGTELVRRRVNTSDHAAVTRALFLIQGVRTVSIVAFGLAGSFAGALVTFWTSAVTRRMGGPLYSAWLTQNIEPRVRATVLSMTNLMDALGQIAGGPAVGALGRSVSVRAALIASGVLLAPVLALLLRASRQPGRASEPREALAQARE